MNKPEPSALPLLGTLVIALTSAAALVLTLASHPGLVDALVAFAIH